MTALFLRRTALALSALLLLSAEAGAADWAEWRGPLRDGVSREKGLPSKWSPITTGVERPP